MAEKELQVHLSVKQKQEERPFEKGNNGSQEPTGAPAGGALEQERPERNCAPIFLALMHLLFGGAFAPRVGGRKESQTQAQGLARQSNP